MRLENIALFEIGFVGGDERHAVVVGPTQELRLNRALARQAVPLDLDIKALAERSTPARRAVASARAAFPAAKALSAGSVRAARKRDQAFRAVLKLRQA